MERYEYTHEKMAAISDYKEYIDSKLSPLLETLVTEILLEKPNDLLKFMISRLCIKAGYSDPTQEVGESDKRIYNEIAALRKEIRIVVSKDNSVCNGNTDLSTETDEEDDEEDEDDDEDFDEEVALKMKGFNKMRQSVSAEVYGEWNKKGSYTPHIIEKTDDQKKRLQEMLKISFMFQNLEAKDLQDVINAMQEKKIPENFTLIRQGHDGECLFLIERGELGCYKETKNEAVGNDSTENITNSVLVKRVGAGDIVGELALLYNAPRAATVKSFTDCILWKLDRNTFNAIIKESATKRRDMYMHFLEKVKLLHSMSECDRLKLCDALLTEEYKDGAYILKQGEQGDKFYLVEEGTCIAMKQFSNDDTPQPVETYGVGDYFGELALITGEPRAASIVAKGPVRVACLERRSFKRLMGSVEEIMNKKAQEYKHAAN